MLKPENLVAFRERIAISKDFSPEERNLILTVLNLGDYAGQHEYPDRWAPGKDVFTTMAWKVLDQLAPGKLTRADRFMLGGMMAGALSEMFESGKMAVAGKADAGSTILNEENKDGMIDAVYACLSVDAGGEGLCAGPIGKFGVAPLVCTQRKQLPVIVEIARAIGRMTTKPIRVVRFTMREDLETLKP